MATKGLLEVGKAGFEGDHLARGKWVRGYCGCDYVGKEVGAVSHLAR